MDNLAINGGRYKKIDIYLKDLNGNYVYECSTNSYATCKQAKASFLAKHNYLDVTQVKASFSN
jgi:hypothetical protein